MDYTLHQGRCQDILPGDYAGQVSLVVTSPPYDGLRSYGGYNDAFDFDAVADAVLPCLKPGGVLVWVVGDAIVNGSETGTSFRQALGWMDRGLRLHQTLIYERMSLAGCAHNRYLRNWEYAFVFSQGKPAAANMLCDRKNVMAGTFRPRVGAGRASNDQQPLDRGKPQFQVGEYGRRTAIWHYGVGKGARNHPGDLHYSALTQHPAIFPQDLARDHILSWSNPGDLVLDPMAGSGTTLRAAVNHQRRAVGVEVNPEYCRLIRRRMGQLVLALE